MDLIMTEASLPMVRFALFACLISVHFDNVFAYSEAIPSGNINHVLQKNKTMFHITTLEGWLRYPSAFTVYKGQYHVFYEYHPSNAPNSSYWGHVVSENLVDWIHYPAALVPNEFYDKKGCLAGSAIEYRDYLVLFYTGYTVEKHKSVLVQNIAMSRDGISFLKYSHNPTIRDPPKVSFELRNPKVWCHEYMWYMIGVSSRAEHAELVLYTSEDLLDWNYSGVLVQSFGDMGYVWEHPDVLEIGGRHILILSVRGIRSNGYRYQNLHQSGYVVSFFDYFHRRFEDLELSIDTFHQLDYGHDFYAPKTVTARDGRKLLIACLGTEQSDIMKPAHRWSVIREVRLNEYGNINMTPIQELAQQRVEILEEAWYLPGESFKVGTKYFELVLSSPSAFSDVGVMFKWKGGKFSIDYTAMHGYITIDRGGIDGVRRAFWSPPSEVYLRVFVDRSSIEIFCGDGEVVFSSLINPRSMYTYITGKSQVFVLLYRLGSSKRFLRKKFKK